LKSPFSKVEQSTGGLKAFAHAAFADIRRIGGANRITMLGSRGA
jgi:hypothetical protein